MKSISLICVATTLLSLTSLCQAQTWSLEYGTEDGKIAYCNQNNDPDFAEDSPYGPMSFRVLGDKLWLLDSVAGKLNCYDKNGKKIKSLIVPNLEGFKLLEDFAFDGSNPDVVWVANAADCLIRKISLSKGKVLAKIGGNGNEASKILQVSQLESDSSGRLYVGDIARSKISIFNPNGSFLREFNWQSSGFVVDKNSNLHLLHYSDSSGYSHRTYSINGQLLQNTHLGFVANINAKLLSVDKDNNLILSMIPKEGFKGTLLLYKINKTGLVKEKLEYIPPSTLNREIYVQDNKIYQVEADFETAPKTRFIVKTLEWEKKTSQKNDAK